MNKDVNTTREEQIDARLAARAKTVKMGRDPLDEYLEDLKDGDIGARQEGDLCTSCGAASVRYCAIKDDTGGFCPWEEFKE